VFSSTNVTNFLFGPVGLMDERNLLSFEPFRSAVDNSFWAKLAELKLNDYKTDESEKELVGYYSTCKLLLVPYQYGVHSFEPLNRTNAS